MHVTEILLDAYHRGLLSAEQFVEILTDHYAATCTECSAAIGAYEARAKRGLSPDFEMARDPVARLAERFAWRGPQAKEEVRIARRQVREIVRLAPRERRRRIAGAHSRYMGPLFGALLLEEARRRIPGEPAEALTLAEVALLSASRKNRRAPEPEVQAAALAVRGNARRALGRLAEAEADLEEARKLLDDPGLRDPALPAEVYWYLGALRKDQGKLEEAGRHLGVAGVLYRALAAPEQAARVLLTLGIVHFRAHAFDAAVAAVEEALALMPPDAEAWLLAYAHYDLAWYLHGRGDLDRAEAELGAHAELLAAAGERVAQHVTWLRARIAWSRSDLRAAGRLYREARAGVLTLGFPFEASLLSLELALVELVQGRTARVKTLAAEALRLLADQEEVEREVRAAVALAEEAARREALTRELIERTIATLEDARHGRPVAARSVS
jgi:tetratricopeptide (TPR) repeat protein